MSYYHNHIRGTRYDDELMGTENNDTIKGFKGNDTLVGQGGDDHLLGGRGNDSLFGDEQSLTTELLSNETNQQIDFNFGNDYLLGDGYCQKGHDHLVGDVGSLTLTINPRFSFTINDITGNDGESVIADAMDVVGMDGQINPSGSSANNVGLPDNILSYHFGNDHLKGGSGRDVLTGDTDLENINLTTLLDADLGTTSTGNGGSAHANSTGNAFGGNGGGIFFGSNSSQFENTNIVNINYGDDSLIGDNLGHGYGQGKDSLYGDAIHSQIDLGFNYSLTLARTTGNGGDAITLGTGAATGGNGADLNDFNSSIFRASQNSTVNINGGNDTLFGNGGRDLLVGDHGTSSLTLANTIQTDITLTSGNGGSAIADNTGLALAGDAGSLDFTNTTTIRTNGQEVNYNYGNDTLQGGNGRDTVIGDTQFVELNFLHDITIGLTQQYGNAGNADGIASGGDSGTIATVITLNSIIENNTVYYAFGDDDVQGDRGRDTLYGDAESVNIIEELLETPNVTVVNGQSGMGTNGGIPGAQSGGAPFVDLSGVNTQSNVVTLEFGDDILHGGKGRDHLYGDTGSLIITPEFLLDNTINIIMGSDTLYGGRGADTFHFNVLLETTIGSGFDTVKDLTTQDSLQFDLDDSSKATLDVDTLGGVTLTELDAAFAVVDLGAGNDVTINYLNHLTSSITLEGIGTAGNTLDSLQALDIAGYDILIA